MKNRVKTWQVRGIWSQQLEHNQVTKRWTEPGVRKMIFSNPMESVFFSNVVEIFMNFERKHMTNLLIERCLVLIPFYLKEQRWPSG